jgi:hypothetical protein
MYWHYNHQPLPHVALTLDIYLAVMPGEWDGTKNYHRSWGTD